MLFMKTKAHPGVVSEAIYRVEVRNHFPVSFYRGNIHIVETEIGSDSDDTQRQAENTWWVCVYDPGTEDLLVIVPHVDIKFVRIENHASLTVVQS